jgi:hypothetical protein
MPKWKLPRIMADVAAIRAFTKHVADQAVVIKVAGVYKEYTFDAASMAVDDGDLVLKPTDILLANPGRWLLVDDGGGGAASAVRSDYRGTSANVPENTPTDFIIAALPGQTEVLLGEALELEITAEVPGTYELEIFKDAARTRSVAKYVFQDTASKNYDTVPFGWDADDANGRMFARVINLAGGGASDVQVDVVVASIAEVGTVEANAIDAELATNPALEFVTEGGVDKLRLKPAPGGGIERVAGGAQLDATVLRTTGDQAIGDKKRFNAVGFTPQGAAGPPAAGAWVVGDLVLDSAGVMWRCTTAGSPGKWSLFQGKLLNFGPTSFNNGGPGLAPEASMDGIIDITGRRVHISRLRVWASDPATLEFDLPFRLELYANEDRQARDLIARLNGMFRKVETSGINAAGQTTVNVNALGSIFRNDLVYLLDAAGVLNEFNRVSARLSGPERYTMVDELLNPYADDSEVLYVSEFFNLVFFNNSLDPLEQQKIFWRLHHDGLVADGDPTLDKIFLAADMVDLPGGELG